MATIDYKQLATPEANLIELLAAQNQDGTYSAKLMGSEPFAVLAAKTIYNAYNDIEANISADVEGPASSTDNAIARFDGATGKIIQNSLVTIDDLGGISTAEGLTVSNVGLARGIFFLQGASQRGQIIYTSGAIQFLSGTTTNGLVVGSSTSQLQFNNSALATLTGSLTVGGNLIVSGTTGVTATDLILGTSGPSVKSTLSARAPRQGLVFDGTANGSFSALSAFGTGDFTYAAWIYVPATIDSSGPALIGGATNSFTLRVLGNLGLQSTKVNIYDNVQSSITVQTSKWNFVTYRRTGTSAYYGINGVEGASVTDSQDYSAGCSLIGHINAGYPSSYIWPGAIAGSLVYNRALSASEVVALYEAGAPSAADYNTASSTTIISGAWVKNAGTGTFTSTASTDVAANTSNDLNSQSSTTFAVRPGQKIALRGSFTGISGSISVFLYDGANFLTTGYALTATGAEMTVNTASSIAQIYIVSSGACAFTGTSVSVVRLGLLLAPDAAQAGGGLVWYDTSGNAANITLPASGVSWNVPSSRVLGGNWTTSGNLTVSGTGTSSVAGNLALNGANSYLAISPTSSVTGAAALQLSVAVTDARALRMRNTESGGHTYDFIPGGGGQAGSLGLYDDTAGGYRLFITDSGNLLLGTTTDGGQKLQVAGTAAITGAISIGNTVNTVSPTSPNRTITMVIGGTTYYIAAKTTND